MICKTRTDQSREWQRASRERKRRKGICNNCELTAVPGTRYCAKCRAAKCRKNARQREAYRFCQCCRDEQPLVPGGFCGKCCELMAKDALRTKAHSRCDEVGTLELDRETLSDPDYRAAKANWVSGQRQFKFIGKVSGIPVVEPYEAPEYSVGVFSEALRWEG